MQAYFGERVRFDLASAILYSNSEMAWKETKSALGDWGKEGQKEKASNFIYF